MRLWFLIFCVVLALHALALCSFRMGSAIQAPPKQLASFKLIMDSSVVQPTVPAPVPPKIDPSPQEPIPALALSQPGIRPDRPPPPLAPVFALKAVAKSQAGSTRGVASKPAQAPVERRSPITSGRINASQKPNVTTRPRYRSNPRPVYPAESRRLRQEGQAILTVKVNAKGRVESVALKRSSGFLLLDQSAIKAVRNWTFEPGLASGVPVSSEIEVPIRFRASY